MLPVKSIKKIYFIRNHRVMLDRDLAELYGVETKRLKEQVRRNLSGFPENFMFVLTNQEVGVELDIFPWLSPNKVFINGKWKSENGE